MRLIAFLLALLPSLAFAQTPIAYRVGKGLQLVPFASCHTAVSKASGNGMLCIDSSASNVLKYKNPAGTTITLGAAGAGSTGNWTFSGDAADDTGAAVLTIGATTATGVTIGRSAGANILAADTTIASGKKITGAAGADLRLNAVSGQTLKLRINDTDVISVAGSAVTLSQPLVLTGTQTGTYTLGGTPTITAPIINGAASASGNFDLSGSSGTFKTTTGASTFGGSSNTFTNAIVSNAGVTVGGSTNTTAITSAGLVAISNNGTTTGGSAALTVTNNAGASAAHTAALPQPIMIVGTGSSDNQWTGGGSWAHAYGTAFARPYRMTFTSSTTVPIATNIVMDGPISAGTNATITKSYNLFLRNGGGIYIQDSSTPTTSELLRIGNNAESQDFLKVTSSAITAGVPLVLTGTQTGTYTLGGTVTVASPIFSGSLTGTYNIGGTPTATSIIQSNVGNALATPTWTAVTYTNSWVDYGASTTTRYTKGPDGKITLEIRAKNGSSGTAQMFAMPANFRPGQNLQLVGYNASGATCLGDLIASTGAFNASFGAATSGMFFRIEYYAEQ